MRQGAQDAVAAPLLVAQDAVDRRRGGEIADRQIGQVLAHHLGVAQILAVQRDGLEEALGGQPTTGIESFQLPAEGPGVGEPGLLPALDGIS